MVYLSVSGFEVFRRNVSKVKFQGKDKDYYVKFADKGQSDLYGKMPASAILQGGVHFELEVKRPGEWPRIDQVEWLIRMNGRGKDRSVAFWADNVQTVIRVMDAVLRGARVIYDTGQYHRFGEFHLEY